MNGKRRKDLEKFRIGVDVDDTHQVEVKVSYSDWSVTDWVSAAEYGIELVRSQHPHARVELAYVKEFHHEAPTFH